MKRALKRIASDMLSTCDYDAIRRAIDAHDTVSFDIFDTLIVRRVHNPQDVFDLVSKRVSRRYGIKLQDFREKRIRAEMATRRSSARQEVTLDEIYGFLAGNLTEREIALVKQTEVETEIDVCEKKAPLAKCYEHAAGVGRHLIITSDMYLPRTCVERILANSGYENYEKLYLSSETLLTKQKGSIFKKIREEYGKSVLHIGDNPRGDWLMPRREGLDALLIKG